MLKHRYIDKETATQVSLSSLACNYKNWKPEINWLALFIWNMKTVKLLKKYSFLIFIDNFDNNCFTGQGKRALIYEQIWLLKKKAVVVVYLENLNFKV